MDYRFKKYTINPLSGLGAVGGFAFGDLLSYKPGVKALVYDNGGIDTTTYYNELRNGGQGYREFKLTSKNPVGLPIADQWCEFRNGDTIYYIECPIMKLSQTKIINKTQVYGYEGTVKEFVATSDWEIDFTFYIVGQRRMEIDYSALYLFLELAKLPSYIEINSPLLNDVFDIDKVVIDKVNGVNQHETYNNIMVVNLTLLSDKDYEPFTKLANE